jgi:hypothetical protein
MSAVIKLRCGVPQPQQRACQDSITTETCMWWLLLLSGGLNKHCKFTAGCSNAIQQACGHAQAESSLF